MKNPIKTIATIFFLIGVICVFTFSGCVKEYDEGPAISFRGHKARLKGTWEVEELFKSGQTVKNYTNWTFEFMKNGKYKETRDNIIYEGTWELSDDNKYVNVTYYATAGSNQTIMRLTKDEYWFDWSWAGYTFHLKKL